ncbi:PA2169 family four-helix-bundle protein [soil metagenome]
MINDYEATKPMTTDAEPVAAAIESNDSVIDRLNGLIQVCKDGQYGYKDAAEGIERPDLKKVFYEFSQQRSEFTGVLQELVRSLGGDPEKAGSIYGAIHRGWIDIKAAVTGKDEGAILNECERGEDFAKEAYADALTAKLPANVTDIVAQQSHAIVAAHNRIKELRNVESHKTATPAN